MNFLEKNLEDIIFENKELLSDRGLVNIFYKNTKRQVIMPFGRKIDMLTWGIVDDVIYARIIELKKDCVGYNALYQSVQCYIDFIATISGYFKDYKIEIVLIGDCVSGDIKDIGCTSDLFRFFDYTYKLDGIYFREYHQNCSYLKSVFNKLTKDEAAKPFIASLVNL